MLFRVLAATSPLILLGAAELVARLLSPPEADDPYLHIRAPVSIFSEVEEGGRRYYQVTHPEAYRAQGTRFPVVKPPGTLRVFCLGGSASAGWPHPAGQTYGAYLEEALRAAFPDRRVEVLNTSGHAFASYRVRLIFDDVIRFDPDLLIVYSGNNEFVERRSYAQASGLSRLVDGLARASRLFRVVHDALRGGETGNTLSGAGRQDQSFHVWSHVERVALELRTDPEQYRSVRAHYRYSLEHMAREAAARGVPIVLLTVPSNLRDWHPHVSTHELRGEELQRWKERFRAALAAGLRGRTDRAVELLRALVAEEPGHAEAHFRLARALEKNGRAAAAYAEYARARDEDKNPFRAPGPLNEIVREVAARHGAVLVDAERAFARAARAAAPGFDLFLDYVHPTKEGNLLLARRVFEAVIARRLLGEPARTEFHVSEATRAYRDDDDVFVQLTLLGLFSILHQYESFLPKLAHVRELLARKAIELPAEQAAVLDACERAFRDYLENRRREILGEAFDPDYRERHKTFYRRFFLAISDMKAALALDEAEGPK